MKTLKIFLAVSALAIIGFFSWYWYDNLKNAPETKPPTNQFTEKIESDIESLGKMPSNSFCGAYYKSIESGIDEFYNDGSLGLTSYKEDKFWKQRLDSVRNKQWKKILRKNLYSTYAIKFIDQAMYVFKGAEWKINDIKFIRDEVKALKESPYLDDKGSVAHSFNEISAILAKYDEITNFINGCKGFSYTDLDIKSSFPNLSAKIIKAKTYLKNNLDNSYVNNCAHLKEDLKDIPKILFSKNISYLKQKINHNGKKYTEINFQPEYARYIYIPLRLQLDALSNNVYGVDVAIFNQAYKSLDALLKDFNHQSLEYYNVLHGKS